MARHACRPYKFCTSYYPYINLYFSIGTCFSHFVGSTSKAKPKKLINNFVCGYLAKQAQDLVKVKQDGQSLLIRFNDINKISSTYCTFKSGSRDLKSDTNHGKDNFEDILALLGSEGSLEKKDTGRKFEHGNIKEYMTFEVIDNEMKRVLTSSYPVQKKSRMVMYIFKNYYICERK